MHKTEQHCSNREMFSRNIVLSFACICHHETCSFSELSLPAPGEAIKRFTASEHADFPSLITLNELCKMAAVFWPPGEVAVVKKRMATPRPPLRQEILSLLVPNPIKSVVKPICSLLFIPELHTHQFIIQQAHSNMFAMTSVRKKYFIFIQEFVDE